MADHDWTRHNHGETLFRAVAALGQLLAVAELSCELSYLGRFQRAAVVGIDRAEHRLRSLPLLLRLRHHQHRSINQHAAAEPNIHHHKQVAAPQTSRSTATNRSTSHGRLVVTSSSFFSRRLAGESLLKNLPMDAVASSSPSCAPTKPWYHELNSSKSTSPVAATLHAGQSPNE